MPKILFISNDFLPMVGGVSNHIDALATALTKLGCRVTVLHICYQIFEPKEDTINGYSVVRFYVGSNLSGDKSIISKIQRYIKSLTKVMPVIKSMIRSLQPDVVHWHDYYHSSLSTKFLNKKGMIFVCSNHASQFLEQFSNGFFLQLYLKALSKHADGVIAPSKELAEKSKSLGMTTCFIPNGVNTSVFCPTKEYRQKLFLELDIVNDAKLILAPRRLDPKNGLDVLIKAIAVVLEKRTDVKFVIAGGGTKDLEDEYINLAKKLGVDDYLIITGVLTHDEMRRFIPSADLVVIPSFYEAVSLAALEGLSCGVPVIASNVGGLPYVVNDTNGALFEAGNVHQLAQVIVNHLSDWPSTVIKGKVAREQAVDRHTWELVALKTLDFYKSLSDTLCPNSWR